MSDSGGFPMITICMPVYNRAWCIGRVLQALYGIDYPKKRLRLVFIDEFSNDGSYDILTNFKESHQNEYESIILERVNVKNIPIARNLSLKFTKGFVFFLDSDVVVQPSILKGLLSHLQNDPQLGMASVPYTTEELSLLDRVYLAREPKEHGYVEGVGMGATLIRPEVIEKIGDFNEKIHGQEDSEYCFRVRKEGWKILMKTSLRGIHLRPGIGSCKDAVPSSGPLRWDGTRGTEIVGRYFDIKFHLIYNFTRVPLYVHELIKQGSLKHVVKSSYYFSFPYVVACLLLIWQPLLALAYFLPPILIHSWKTRGWMKIPAFLIFMSGGILMAHGLVWMWIRKAFGRPPKWVTREPG